MKINREGQLIRKKNLCKRLWNHPFVYYDGIVYSCEYFTSENTPQGNVFEEGFRPVWFGQSFREPRKDYARKSKGAQCTICPRNFADADKNVSHIFRMKDEKIGGKQPAANTNHPA
jgi:radical SAM protein with 4Fe4S-binding SPASM domain